ncbi:hypothetical protein JR316_0004754 [Psilocybe cubensis]|uniref:Uncharacterized protein n=1 Tax=Psilocybe cubensis TaxID=181762 RepID=A0ACB8H4L7_PSICU|nr:hypothetical protein JR316_0004754 [Psilocybe cubensis]KAH9482654.1 hypothetical protein JR316_0004754 [Psilocybe cubensis]
MTSFGTNVDHALLAALIASIDRLSLAIGTLRTVVDPAVVSESAVPSDKEQNIHLPDILAMALPDVLSNNTGRHPDVVKADLAKFTGPVDGPWYAVTCGRVPGIYQHSVEANYHTDGVPGSAKKKYDSQAQALEAYRCAYALGAVRRRDM